MLHYSRILKRVKKNVKKILDRDISKNKVKLPGGGKVTYVGVSWLSSKAKVYEEDFMRPGTAAIRTNIHRHTSAAMRTRCRDHYLQILLESGTYTFNHILMIRNPYGEAPLTAMALFQTPEPCAIRVTVKGDSDAEDYVSELPATKLHRVPILGLYPNRQNIVRIERLDADRNVLDVREIPVETKKLPKDVRGLVKVKKVAPDPAFQNILIAGGLYIRTFAFDKVGDIRYFLRRQVKGYGVFPLAKGRFLFMEKRASRPTYGNPAAAQAHDMDYMGRVYKTYFSRTGMHHSVEEKTPGGNLLICSNTLEGHTEDLLVEVDRNTGQIVKNIRLDQIFDDTYIDMVDWAHINSAAYYEEDDLLLTSQRNLHTVACVDYSSGKLRWMLAEPEFWEDSSLKDKVLKPVGDVPWFYQQHSAFFLEQEEGDEPHIRRMIVFDNHWTKRRAARNYDNDDKSYVSIYVINEKDMTVQLERRFGHHKTKIRSNGIYCRDEKRIYSMAGMFSKSVDGCMGCIYEFDYETGECLSKLYIKPGFFRAYDFTPDPVELSKPLPLDPKTDDYFCGDLERPVLLSEQESQQVRDTDCEKVSYSSDELFVEEDVLFVWGTDHHVGRIYLVGEKAVYMTSFEDTYQTMDVFKKTCYHVCTWLDELPQDRYQLILKVDDELRNTGKWIEKI